MWLYIFYVIARDFFSAHELMSNKSVSEKNYIYTTIHRILLQYEFTHDITRTLYFPLARQSLMQKIKRLFGKNIGCRSNFLTSELWIDRSVAMDARLHHIDGESNLKLLRDSF